MSNSEPKIEDLITGPEIAYLAGVKMPTFERWKIDDPDRPRVLPEHYTYFGLTPVWDVNVITAWLDESNRSYDLKGWRKAREAGEFQRRTPPNAKATS